MNGTSKILQNITSKKLTDTANTDIVMVVQPVLEKKLVMFKYASWIWPNF